MTLDEFIAEFGEAVTHLGATPIQPPCGIVRLVTPISVSSFCPVTLLYFRKSGNIFGQSRAGPIGTHILKMSPEDTWMILKAADTPEVIPLMPAYAEVRRRLWGALT